MATIVVVEDDLRLRSELQKSLEQKQHTVICCSDGLEAIKTVKNMPFDIIITDLKIPIKSGIQVIKEIHELYAFHPAVIIITGHGDKQNAIQALQFGAFDFLEKPFSPTTLFESVERALRDKREEMEKFKSLVQSSVNRETLTSRENEVALLAAEGLTNEQIADRLSLGTETIKAHLKKIFRKLGVSNRTALVSKIQTKKAA